MFGEEKNKNRDGDPPTDRSLISRILEFAIVVAVSGYLIKLGICYFLQVWWVLLIIVLIAGGAVVLWRIWKEKNDTKW